MKLYLRMFTVTGIQVGILAGIITFLLLLPYDSLMFAAIGGMVAAPIAGILSGLLFALILTTLHIKIVKKLPYYTPGLEQQVKQGRNISMDLSYEDAWKACVSILQKMKLFDLREDRKNNVLSAKSGFSKFSAGENVEIKIERRNDQKVEISIRSQPRITFTLVDCGKNIENVMTIYSSLRSIENNT